MLARAVFGCSIAVASPCLAEDPYEAAVVQMLSLAAEDLSVEANRRIAECYVNAMSPDQRLAMASNPDPDTAYSILLALPMSATDCEKAVLSGELGEEFR